jgi:LmbE family N-acetylglucosaminyl deacetylase
LRRDDAGGEVYAIVVSVGDMRHYKAEDAEVAGETREAELRAAMDMLKVDGYEILFRDTQTHLRLDAVPRRDLIALLERDAHYAIDKIRPTAIVLPHPSYNQDHEAVFKAGFAACRPHLRADKPFINMVLACDAAQLGWGDGFRPDLYVDISEHLTVKLDALACHRSQLRRYPDPGSIKNVEHLARLRGANIAVDAAEAFECHRVVL